MREKRTHRSWHRAGVRRKVRNHTWKLWKCPVWAGSCGWTLSKPGKILGWKSKAWLVLCVTWSNVTCMILPYPGTVGFCRNLVDFLPISRIWAQLGYRSWDVFHAAMPVLRIDPHPGSLQGLWSFLPGTESLQFTGGVYGFQISQETFPTTILQICLSLSHTDVSQHFLRVPLGSWMLRSSFWDLFPMDSQ